jgi:hypothetical protein
MSKEEQKAKELVDRFDETLTYLESKSKAKQCALIAVSNEYHALREQLFNLKSVGLITNNKVYLKRLQALIDEEQQVKEQIKSI